MQIEDIVNIPKFRRYEAGEPSNVIYVQNIEGEVKDDDFHYIFGFVFETDDDCRK